MYLDLETYLELSPSPIASADFPSAEAWAETQLDLLTLNRLHEVDWTRWKTIVEVVMTKLVDSKSSIENEATGQAISHFSNGQDSYTFAKPDENSAYRAVIDFAYDVLPVELMSRAVRYNGAN